MSAPPLDRGAMDACRARLDALSKPLGSLGLLETFAVRLAGIRGTVGGELKRRMVLTFAADNGIHAQNITPVPQEVTARQSALIAAGLAGVNVLARQAGATVRIYNVGVLTEDIPGVVNRRVLPGTADMSAGPAMRAEDARSAFDAGRSAVAENAGLDVAGIGEMGICNTSTTAATAAALLRIPAADVVGPGAGVDAEQLKRKTEAVERAVRLNAPDPDDPLDVLAKVGGLDIAAMAGAFTECAERRIPAVIDGCVSACAALVAVRLEPTVRDYLFGSHESAEPVFRRIMDELGIEAPLCLQMRLGEGSGTPLMFQILADALAIVNEMATLADADINGEGFVDIRTCP